jgi:hypothetical protein
VEKHLPSKCKQIPEFKLQCCPKEKRKHTGKNPSVSQKEFD